MKCSQHVLRVGGPAAEPGHADYIFRLAWESFGVPQDQLVEVAMEREICALFRQFIKSKQVNLYTCHCFML